MVRFVPLLVLVACATAGDQHGDARNDVGKPPDAMIDSNGCPIQPCTILPQCGCVGTSACDLDPTIGAGTACRSISTQGHETTACSKLDDCDKGYICAGNAQFSSCKKYCMADADCGTPRGRCAIDITSNGTPVAGIPPVCSSNCDPVSTNPPECPSNGKCNVTTTQHGGQTVTIASCALAGAGGQGFNCKVGTTGDDTLCAKSLACTTINGGTSFNCRKYCTNPGSTGQCGGSNVCIGFGSPLTLAGVTYGVCAP